MSTPLYSFLKRKPNAEPSKRDFESMQEEQERGSLVEVTARLLRAHQNQSAQLDRLLVELQEQKRSREGQPAQTQASWQEKTTEGVKKLLQERAQEQRTSFKDAQEQSLSKVEHRIDSVERRMDTLGRNVTLVSQQLHTVIQILQPLQELSLRPRVPQQQPTRHPSAYSVPRWPVQYPSSSVAASLPPPSVSRRPPIPHALDVPAQTQQPAQNAPAPPQPSILRQGPTKLKLRMPAQLPKVQPQGSSDQPSSSKRRKQEDK